MVELDLSVQQMGWLFGLGVLVGVLSGIFGVGGAFLSVPIMISVMGMNPTEAVGSTMAYSALTAGYGFWRHHRLGNVEIRSTLLIGAACAVGTLGGYWLHNYLRDLTGESFIKLINGLLAVTLIGIAISVFQTRKTTKVPWLQRRRFKIPPLIDLPTAHVKQVSLLLIVLCGLMVGVLKGIISVGGGIVLIPILILVIGLPPHVAVGTSLGSIVISSLVGAIAYGRDGKVSIPVVVLLLVGGLLGSEVGVRICRRFHADRLRDYFGYILIVVGAISLFSAFR